MKDENVAAQKVHEVLPIEKWCNQPSSHRCRRCCRLIRWYQRIDRFPPIGVSDSHRRRSMPCRRPPCDAAGMGVDRPRSTRRLRSAPLCLRSPTPPSQLNHPGLSCTQSQALNPQLGAVVSHCLAARPCDTAEMGVDWSCRRLRSAPSVSTALRPPTPPAQLNHPGLSSTQPAARGRLGRLSLPRRPIL